MAWYDITYSCGHTGQEQIYGPNKDRQWIADRKAEKLCPDCWKAEMESQRQQEAEKARVTAHEYGLPALEGTAKQIEWAEVLRKQWIEEIQDFLNGSNNPYGSKVKMAEAAQNVMSRTSAHWWIDNRAFTARHILKNAYMEVLESETAAVIKEQVEAETAVRPEKAVSETVAEITIKGDTISVYFPEKRDDFRVIIKKHGFKWSDGWHRSPGYRILDRAAEIAHVLLANGFIVRIPDKQIREMAITGQNARESSRKISKRIGDKYGGWFAISWGRDEDYYAVARRLPRSRYSKPSVVVPPEYFEEVLDFAQRYDFTLSPGAEELVKESRDKKEKMLIVHVEKPEPVEAGKKATIKNPKLVVPEQVEIDEELRDDN